MYILYYSHQSMIINKYIKYTNYLLFLIIELLQLEIGNYKFMI